jgi:anti-sigma regulatory factor (Ser/Thr protein kinase)
MRRESELKKKEKTVFLNLQGVDAAAEAVQDWLTEAGVKHKDILRIRLTIEELLGRILARSEEDVQAELHFSK